MSHNVQRSSYVALCIFALAFGWIEAAAVVYLREIYQHEVNFSLDLQIPLVSLPTRLLSVEIVREGCTLAVLGAVAWVARRRLAERVGAFLLAFGIWDLVYYAVLRLVLGWPDRLTTWDILFLIPIPWVAPVWAPATVAILFVAAGSYLFWTPDRPRRYSRMDLAILFTAAFLVLAAFLVEWRVVLGGGVPQRFPHWLFWSGVILGSSWFVSVERRDLVVSASRGRWAGVRVRPALLETADEKLVPLSPRRDETGLLPDAHNAVSVEHIVADYKSASRQLDALVKEADEIGERFERLGRALSTHPTRTIIGLPDPIVENPNDYDIVPAYALPSIERLKTLTKDIQTTLRHVDDYRERLILLGRGDAVEQPDGFFR